MRKILAFFLSFIYLTDVAQTTDKGLFDDENILEIRLSGNLRDMMADRTDEPKNYPITLSYKKPDSSFQSLQILTKTRGHFRKQKGVCDYPPLLLSFTPGVELKASIFKDQNRMKLVMPCSGDQYVVREYMVYKIYNLVTPKSFRARLVRVTLDDTERKKQQSFYGILLEEENQVALRNNGVSVVRKIIPEQSNKENFLQMALFEYLIGNTDWSVQYLQNIKLIAPDSTAVPYTIPYDFDHSGMVNVPYAKPAEELQLGSVRIRRYRGYCIADLKQFEPAIALYNRIKVSLYALYRDNTILDPKYIKQTISYFDEFYETINNPKGVQKEFGYPCNKNGTGNVVIKGLQKDQ